MKMVIGHGLLLNNILGKKIITMPKTDTILSVKSLRYFLQLIDTMNYTQAAQILGITQPALTQQVKKLEYAIGAPLFGQMGKKLYLTEAGKEMESAAVELLSTINGVISDIQEYTQADKGNISVGVLDTLQADVFYEFLRFFHRKYPEVTFSVDYYDRKELWRRLDTNLIDLAIMYLPDNTKKEETNLRHQYNHHDISSDRLVVLTHKTTVEAGETYPVSRFINRKWIAYPDDFYVTHLMYELFGKKHKPDISMEIASTKEMVQMAEVTDYDTYVTQSYYDAHKDEISLTPIYLQGEHDFHISYVYRKGKLEIPRMENMLKEFVTTGHYKFADHASDWKEAIRMSCESLEADGTVDPNYKEEIVSCVEKYGPYIIIAPNIALPHSQEGATGVNKTAIGFMKLEQPVSFDPEDPEKDAQLFFTLASCDHNQHLENMMRLSEMLMNEDLVKGLENAKSPEDLLELESRFLENGEN